MPVPTETFASWVAWARDRFASTTNLPLINEKVYTADLLFEEYNEFTDNAGSASFLKLCSPGT
jgi:hypothetical protein